MLIPTPGFVSRTGSIRALTWEHPGLHADMSSVACFHCGHGFEMDRLPATLLTRYRATKEHRRTHKMNTESAHPDVQSRNIDSPCHFLPCSTQNSMSMPKIRDESCTGVRRGEWTREQSENCSREPIRIWNGDRIGERS